MRLRRLILASASPRRRELLTQAGFTFEAIPAHIDESRREGETAKAYVQRLAVEKATLIAERFPEAVVLGADTTVVLDGEFLNKPADIDEARRMLVSLGGRGHEVLTGVAVVGGGRTESCVEATAVYFGAVGGAELEAYLATGDSLDKAGAYGIQGYAARWIPRIEGDFFNVMGLPIATVVRMLAAE
jgi:septum formation protein